MRASAIVVACMVVACGSVTPSSEPSPTPAPAGPWWPVETGLAANAWIPTLGPATIDEPTPHVYGGSTATAVVEFRGSLLAFGGVNGGCCDGSFSTDTHAVVWSSVDGHAWRLHETGPELALGSIAAAAASADRVVVVGARHLPSREEEGSLEYQGAVWTSGDGEMWELVADVPAFATVLATASGFVAASHAEPFPELWWSETGSSWQRIAALPELGAGRIHRLLATPIGFFGVGSAVNPEAGGQAEIDVDPPAAVWRSTDGRSWVQVPWSATFAGASMLDVAWSDGRLLAVGFGGAEARPAFWTSTDGDTWDRIQAPGLDMGPGATEAWPSRVIGVAHGFAVAATWSLVTDDSARIGRVVWATRDGLGWEAVGVQGETEIHDWALLPGGGVAVVGSGYDPDIGRAVPLAWTIAAPP
ncbi:MAG: hypothetical protein ABI620_02360 [Chloroflexota bacterium]